jgi:hypothetical protein
MLFCADCITASGALLVAALAATVVRQVGLDTHPAERYRCVVSATSRMTYPRKRARFIRKRNLLSYTAAGRQAPPPHAVYLTFYLLRRLARIHDVAASAEPSAVHGS